MSSPFQRAFSSKSPLNEHKKIQRQINMLRNNPGKAERKGLSSEGQGGIDYEKISQLEAKLPAAKEAHNKNRTEEESAQVREDEDAAQGSAAEMRSPLNGSYTSPAGEPYVSHVGMIQQAAGAVQGALDSYMNESEANKAKRLSARAQGRMNRLDHSGVQKYEKDGKLVELKESDFYDDINTATDEQKKAFADAKENASYYNQDNVNIDHIMDKTADIQNRAITAGQNATAQATAEKDAEIEELKKKIELLKTK